MQAHASCLPGLALVTVGLALAAKLLAGCGSSGGQAAGVDASSIDGSVAGDAGGGGVPGLDANGQLDVAGQADAGSADGSSGGVADGGSWLDGSMAFGVRYSVFVPENLSITCSYAPGPSTGYGDLVVLMTDVDIPSICVGSAFARPDAAVGHPFVRIEVESPSYRADGGALTMDGGSVVALVPGSYSIGYGRDTAANVCMLAATNGTALVDLMTFTDEACCDAVAGTSLSGTVALTTVDEGHVVGDFNVMLAPNVPDAGGVITSAAAPLSGHFDTTTCPGVAQ